GPLPTVERAIDVADHGAVPDDGKDDSAAIIAAIAAAREMGGPVRVQFGPGRYQLTEILWIEQSGIVLAGTGSGAGGTELYMPRPLNQLDDGGALDELRIYLERYDKRERQPDQNLDVLFSEWSWSGGFIWTRVPNGRHATYLEEYDRPIEEVTDIGAGRMGERRLTVADTSGLSVGDVLQIHWHNRDGEDGPLIAALYGEDRDDFPVGDRHWMLPDRPLVRQATRIEAVSGTTVTIADPLLHNIGPDLPAYFARWEHLSDVGIQDMALTFPENPYFGHHNEAGYNGVYFTGVHNGWISNLRISNADSGVLTDDLAAVTIANVTTQGDHKAHYAVHIGNVHNVLVTKNEVFNPTVHTFSFNTQSTRSVYHRSTGWEQPTLDQHAGANHQNLYDDIAVHVRPDAATDGDPATYELFRAGGAGYWLPGHGRYNTIWNLDVIVANGAAPGERVVVQKKSGGPDARIVGLHGNRPIVLDYNPAPYVELEGSRVLAVPSLYDWQLRTRER
ncbi:MAG: glycosyl hydrolase family 28-related protein, partial [Alteraurantiacibacter sp.]